MQLVNRTTCLYCEQAGKATPLIFTARGGYCPLHSRAQLLALGIDPGADPDSLPKGEAA